VNYSMKQTSSFFDCCNAFIDFTVCDCSFKGPVQCFSMQVVLNKYFLLNPEKNFGPDPTYRFRGKRKTT